MRRMHIELLRGEDECGFLNAIENAYIYLVMPEKTYKYISDISIQKWVNVDLFIK